MAKVWVNPKFKEVYTPTTTTKKTEKTKKIAPKKAKKPTVNEEKLRKKRNPGEEYIKRKIQDRKIVNIKFIDNEEITGIIQWTDQRYMKISTDKEGLVIEKRAIKYIK